MLRAAAPMLLTGVLLIGCAGTPEPTRDPSPPRQTELDAIAAAIAGDYVAIKRPGDTLEPVRLRVEAEPDAIGAALLMTQVSAGVERRFRLQLGPGASPETFDARFIPLRAGRDDAGPACAMRFRLAAGLLVGETDPDECRFQSGGLSIGLLKEISFEGDRILMADQLLLEDGSPFADADRLALGRVTEFSGMLAHNEHGSWRIARNLRLASGGNLVEPLDAAGMSLGVLLNLELVESMERQVPALRLQVLDEATGRVTAEVWNDIDAGLIGLGLETLRIELYRQP